MPTGMGRQQASARNQDCDDEDVQSGSVASRDRLWVRGTHASARHAIRSPAPRAADARRERPAAAHVSGLRVSPPQRSSSSTLCLKTVAAETW